MDITYDSYSLEPLKKDLAEIKKKIVCPTYNGLIQLKDALAVYYGFRRIKKGYCQIATSRQAVELFKSRYKEIRQTQESMKVKCKRLKEVRFPLSNRIYNSLVDIMELGEYINGIDIAMLREREDEGMLTPEKKITAKPYTILISMGLYIIILIAIIVLTIIDVIPLASSILGGIIGLSFFSTAVSDYRKWRKKYAK